MPSRQRPVPPGKPWLRAQVWAIWLRGRAENAEKTRNAVALSKAGAQDIASLLVKASALMTPPQLTPTPTPKVVERLAVGDPTPANKRYPHFADDVPASERRRIWVEWLHTRRIAKLGPEGIADLISLLSNV